MPQPAEQESKFAIERARSVIQTLTLPDIFGKARDNPLKIPITEEQYKKWSLGKDEEGKRAFARLHSIEDFPGVSFERGECFLNESYSTKELAFWLPYPEERIAILQIAQAAAQGKKPVILEVGYGSGLVSNLLASDGHANVVGVDDNSEELRTNIIPDVPGVTLFTRDIWDMIDRFGPSFSVENEEQRKKLLEAVRQAGQTFEVTDHFGDLMLGNPNKLNEEIANLQSIAPQAEQESPIDVVLCSFMSLNSELTVPIRDGIFPKVIIYVRPNNRKSGAGDFYEVTKDNVVNVDDDINDDNPFQAVNPNSHISFNPGVNYTAVYRWGTPWAQDLPSFGFDWESEHKVDKSTAEVVVQVRKDVVLDPVDPLLVGRYNFDNEMKDLWGEKLQEFLAGIKSVQPALFDV